MKTNLCAWQGFKYSPDEMRRNMANKFISILLLLSLGITIPGNAYSVLTHLAIIDVTWDNTLVFVLKRRYPGITPEQLKEAHAYAYGGAIMPDMGYFPFGSKLFTNLVHYVRSGDFISALLDEASDVNEYAFALGALAHYNADNYGHPLGTNRCTPMIFPKARKKFGDTVTYGEDPVAHIRTEFSFDVLKTARGNYAPLAYHDFIGFQVSESVLKRAFKKTYALDITDVFPDFERSVNTFRWAVKELFPVLTRTAWASKQFGIRKSAKVSRHAYVYKMHRKEYYRQFGRKRDKPGFVTNTLSVIVRILPKIGPLKKLKIVIPGPETEKIFNQSFDTVVVHYVADVHKVKGRHNVFPNIDFDTGKETSPGEYELADNSYADLLLKLHRKNFSQVDSSLRQNIIRFYADRSGSTDSKKSAEISDAIRQLQHKP